MVFSDLVEGIRVWWESALIGGFFLVVGKRMSKFLDSAGLLPIPCIIRGNPILAQFGPKLENFMMIFCKAFFSFKHFTVMGCNTLTKVTIVNSPPSLPPPPRKKKCPRPICHPKLWSPVFCDEHVHKYQTQLSILTKLKKSFCE